jgi:DNA-binding NarL/FixJ family response regulator
MTNEHDNQWMPPYVEITYSPEAEELLTDRQKDVIELTAQGLSQNEICSTLGIVRSTLESHINNISQNLDDPGLHSSGGWLVNALREGLIGIE